MTNPAQPLGNIVIIGDGLRAALPAAYLAARCAGSGCRITVVPTSYPFQETGTVFARPNIRHLHQLLQIPEKNILGPAQGRRRFAWDFNRNDNKQSLPFGGFGKPYKGVAFQQIVTCLWGKNPLKPLSHYNLNLALHKLGDQTPVLESTDFGYVFPRHLYASMMLHYAQKLGVKFITSVFKNTHKDSLSGHITAVESDAGPVKADCVILVMTDVKGTEKQTLGWNRNCLYIAEGERLPAIELYRLQSAMERMNAFMPDQRYNAYEMAEYNRLTLIETQRIEDMEALLLTGIDGASTRPELARKVDIYAERGRIPIEDYEVFSPPEWQAALIGAGVLPRHYDRQADGLSKAELLAHVSQMDADIQSVLRGANV